MEEAFTCPEQGVLHVTSTVTVGGQSETTLQVLHVFRPVVRSLFCVSATAAAGFGALSSSAAVWSAGVPAVRQLEAQEQVYAGDVWLDRAPKEHLGGALVQYGARFHSRWPVFSQAELPFIPALIFCSSTLVQ